MNLYSVRARLWLLPTLASLALTHLLARDLPASPSASSPLPLHPAPKVRRVIQLFMNGGISQMDSFLYRPELQKRGGQKEAGKNLFASPFAFAQHGQCGRWISSVFPHNARCRLGGTPCVHPLAGFADPGGIEGTVGVATLVEDAHEVGAAARITVETSLAGDFFQGCHKRDRVKTG